MKTITTLFLLILLFPTYFFSGEVYGSIRVDGRSVGKGIRIEIISPNQTYEIYTDEYGTYREYVKEEGRCTFKVYYGGQSPTTEIYSYADSVRYDFVLERINGQYFLRRK